MKKILSLVAVSTLVVTSTSNLKPMFTSSVITTSTLINNKIINLSENIFKNGNDILFEKDYRFLAHDFLKIKISYDIFLDMRATYDNEKSSEIKNYFFLMLNNFPKLDNSGAGGSITQKDIYVAIKVIIKNFKDINSVFETLQQGQGLLIVTNTIGSWDKNDYMGAFTQ